MRFAKLTPIVAILALAACDNQPETTAEAPVIEEETAVIEQEAAETGTAIEQETAEVGAEVEQETAEVEAEVEQETAAATEVEPIVEGGGEPEVTVITPEGGDTQTTTAQAPAAGATESTGAISATTAAMIDPGSYASDELSLELSEAGGFTLTGAGGDEVTGDWRVFGDTLTLSNASGATAGAEFPMTCTVAEEGEGFRITAETGSCEMLDGQVFQPQG